MAENKTRPTNVSATQYVNAIEDADRRRDCKAIMKMMKQVTGEKPVMWGPSLVGYGSYHYKYPSGREGDWFLAGFASRKNDITVYLMCGSDGIGALLKKLGKYKMGKSCLYIKKLDDVDVDVLRELVEQSVAQIEAMYDCS